MTPTRMERRFRTIVADPPWPMERGSGYSWRSESRSGVKRRYELDYETQPLEWIADIPVGDMAEADAHLFLWTTQAHLEGTYEVARGWGFEPSYALVWCKPPRGWAPGGVFQSTTEFCLYCRRGRPEPSSQCVDRQWFEWPRGAHSAKPEGFLDLVERTFPGPYLEMFARRDRLGWDTWGDESLNTAGIAA